MRIASRSIIFICIVNLVRGQSELDDSETEAIGDPERWSERITKIDRKGTQAIGLAREDSERHSRRFEEEEIEDPRRRPRPFASTSRAPETRAGESRFESQRENVRNHKESVRVFNLERPQPSPILLPPYAFPSPVYRNDIFDTDVPSSPWNNESSSHAGKSTSSSALDRSRIYEITTFNSSNNQPVESEPSYRDDDSSKTIDTDNDDRWTDFVRESSVNVTNTSSQKSVEETERNLPRSFYIDEELENRRLESSRAAQNRSNVIKNSRGNVKYQHDSFDSEKTFMRKRTFSSSGRYDWQRRATQRSNHFRFSDDSNGKAGAVPGVPGRDYPVHQEHTHHHLRNVVDRFPCPRSPKSHVYLADRASRCQIFYVCYGTNTGVPMVCPNGTLFSEPLQVCDWWFNVAC